MTELKPCPFCGGEARLESDYTSERNETRWSIWHECDGPIGYSAGYGHGIAPWFETPWYTDKDKAIAAWNRRGDRMTEHVTDATTMTVRTFRHGTDKEAALKPLEEAAEVYAAWQDVAYACDEGFIKNGCCSPRGSVPCTEVGCCRMMEHLADELADTITACVNLADRYGLDLQAALDRVEAHNRERGRYQ